MAHVDSVYENPYKEISMLQYLMENGPHPNVIAVTEVSLATYFVIFDIITYVCPCPVKSVCYYSSIIYKYGV